MGGAHTLSRHSQLNRQQQYEIKKTVPVKLGKTRSKGASADLERAGGAALNPAGTAMRTTVSS